MPTITGASSFAAMPVLHALLRRQPQRLLLCDQLDVIADLQPQLLPWCEQQGIKTDLQWRCLKFQAAQPQLPPCQWLIHDNSVRAEKLLQTNSCTAVRRNIVATQHCLLPCLPAACPWCCSVVIWLPGAKVWPLHPGGSPSPRGPLGRLPPPLSRAGVAPAASF